ncbi:hypothetical protein ACRQEF_04285 [Actinotignum sp. GS-2025a]|uniref:hypothetical protein n=1 Tax=Actinotignum sp. GS-2025a TaxID=3427274 RepID=UPI003F48A67B
MVKQYAIASNPVPSIVALGAEITPHLDRQGEFVLAPNGMSTYVVDVVVVSRNGGVDEHSTVAVCVPPKAPWPVGAPLRAKGQCWEALGAEGGVRRSFGKSYIVEELVVETVASNTKKENVTKALLRVISALKDLMPMFFSGNMNLLLWVIYALLRLVFRGYQWFVHEGAGKIRGLRGDRESFNVAKCIKHQWVKINLVAGIGNRGKIGRTREICQVKGWHGTSIGFFMVVTLPVGKTSSDLARLVGVLQGHCPDVTFRTPIRSSRNFVVEAVVREVLAEN